MICIMKRYQQIFELFLKHIPETNKKVTTQQFEQAQFSTLGDREIDPLLRYIESL